MTEYIEILKRAIAIPPPDGMYNNSASFILGAPTKISRFISSRVIRFTPPALSLGVVTVNVGSAANAGGSSDSNLYTGPGGVLLPDNTVNVAGTTVDIRLGSSLTEYNIFRLWMQELAHGTTEINMADITILYRDNVGKPSFAFVFPNSFPTSLSAINVDYSAQSVTDIELSVEFVHNGFYTIDKSDIMNFCSN